MISIKKLFIILSLSPFLSFSEDPTTGILLGLPAIPMGAFPSHASNYGLGGWHTTTNQASIPSYLVDYGTAAWNVNEQKLYILSTNSIWTPVENYMENTVVWSEDKTYRMILENGTGTVYRTGESSPYSVFLTTNDITFLSEDIQTEREERIQGDAAVSNFSFYSTGVVSSRVDSVYSELDSRMVYETNRAKTAESDLYSRTDTLFTGKLDIAYTASWEVGPHLNWLLAVPPLDYSVITNAPWVKSVNGMTGDVTITSGSLGALTNEQDAAALEALAIHTNRADNPHMTSAFQVGAPTSSEFQSTNSVFSGWFDSLFQGTSRWETAFSWGDWRSSVDSNAVSIGILQTNKLNVAATNTWEVGSHSGLVTAAQLQASEAALSYPKRWYDTFSTNRWAQLENGTNIVVYEIGISGTNYTVTLSGDFMETVGNTRPAWTTNVWPFTDGLWTGTSRDNEPYFELEYSGHISTWVQTLVDFPVTLETSMNAQGTATVYQNFEYRATNEIHRYYLPTNVIPPELTSLELLQTWLNGLYYTKPQVTNLIEESVSAYQQRVIWDSQETNRWWVITATNAVQYEFLPVVTNYTVTLSSDFEETITHTRPSWTNNVYPFTDGYWRGYVSEGTLGVFFDDSEPALWTTSEAYPEYPATCTVQYNGLGTATVYQHIYFPTNATGNTLGPIPTNLITQAQLEAWWATVSGGYATTGAVAIVAGDLDLANIAINNHTDNGAIGSDGHLAIGDRALIDSVPSLATTNIVTDAISAPYKAWTGTVTPVNGTATVAIAHGNMPVLVTSAPCVLTLDPTGYGTAGVSRVSLSYYTGTNSFTFATNFISYAETPNVDTNGWNSLLIRRVSNGAWKGVGL